MLKYLNSQVYLTEIPDEISLGISILGCDIHCPDCHSKHTWDINSKGIGIPLTYTELNKLIKANPFITCVLFFGGEWDLKYLKKLCNYTVKNFKLKVALYSGRNNDFFQKNSILTCVNYLKTGYYDKALGGLRSPTTNQRLYRIEDSNWIDITEKFWRTKHENI